MTQMERCITLQRKEQEDFYQSVPGKQNCAQERQLYLEKLLVLKAGIYNGHQWTVSAIISQTACKSIRCANSDGCLGKSIEILNPNV